MRYRDWLEVFLGEAKPASVMPRARVEGRFVLLDVEMARLACFRRKCLLGRNLITLFQCVNSFAKIFLPASTPLSGRRVIAVPRIGPRNTCRVMRRHQALLKNAAFIAVLLQRLFFESVTTRAPDPSRKHPRKPFRRINRVVSGFDAGASIWRRTSPNAQICANNFGLQRLRNDCRGRQRRVGRAQSGNRLLGWKQRSRVVMHSRKWRLRPGLFPVACGG